MLHVHHRVHCRDIMHTAWRTTSVQANAIHDTFYKRNKKTYSLYIVELYKHLMGLLRILEKCEKHLPMAHASLALLLCSQKILNA